MSAVDVAQTLAPESIIIGTALVFLIVDVALLRGREVRTRALVCGFGAVAGLIAAGAVLLQQLSVTFDIYYRDADRILVVDRLSLTLRLVLVGLAAGVCLLSIRYEFTKHVGEYFAVTLFGLVGMDLLVSTENLLMFVVALELLSVCLFILTAFHKGVPRSAEGAAKYFLIGALSSAFLLFGMSYVVGTTGAMDIPHLAGAVARAAGGGGHPALLILGLVFVVVGLGFKLAAVPFHAWAPDAYQGAPTPVTAFIATGSKVASFAIAAKLLVVGFGGLKGSVSWDWHDLMYGWLGALHVEPGWILVLAPMAAASMIWGNVAAIGQKNIKRMLAYSSIAHGGYTLIGLLAADEAGLTAMFTYLVLYSLTNLGAFGVVAALTRKAGGDNLEDFDGMVQRAPLLSVLLMLFVLSLAGVPPLAGFFGKFYLFSTAVSADSGMGLLWLVIVALVTSVVSLYYYLVLLKHVLVDPPRHTERIRAGALWTLPLVVIALLVVGLGVYPQPLVHMFAGLVHIGGFVR